MLSVINQKEKDRYCMISLQYGIKNTELRERQNRLVVAGRGKDGSEVGQRVQSSLIRCYKMDKLWGCNVQHNDYH